jgi:hypothetical protein
MAHQQYIELLCSLPHLSNPFHVGRPGITQVQLQKRMNMLDLNDLRWINKLIGAFYWGGMDMQQDEQQLVARANRFLHALPYEDIREWLQWRMDVRTIVAALRHRRDGEESPEPDVVWGYGRYVRHIGQHWSSPSFGLENRFPWLPEVALNLQKGESYLVEKTLLSAVWNYYCAQQPQTSYGFSAVVLYVIKWDMVNRWCQYSAPQARINFDHLVQKTLEQSLQTLKELV